MSTAVLYPHFYNYKNHRDENIISPLQIIGCFCLDRERNFMSNRSNLKYVKIPKNEELDVNPLDLNKGYEIVQKKPASASNEKLVHPLRYILENVSTFKPESEESTRVPDVDFVCFRGLLSVLMNAPYEKKNDWSILATKYKGIIYLCERLTEKQEREKTNRTEECKKIHSYGFKFEQYMMTDNPDQKPNTDVPVIESEEFCLALQRSIGDHKMLFFAEMDGILSDKKLNLETADLQKLNYVELKSKLEASEPWHHDLFIRHVSRRWWCQCYLVNVSKLFVGTRTQAGKVRKIEEHDVNRLKHMENFIWNKATCMAFVRDVLDFLACSMKTIDCPDTVFQLDFDPQESRRYDTNSSVKLSKAIGKNSLSFLPDWYIQGLKKKSV